MARNYTAIHYIQEKLSDYNERFTDVAIRTFNGIHEKEISDGCLCTSVILYIAAKKYGYKPEICYGLCKLKRQEFYHAWLEINNTVIDMAIYGNVNFTPFGFWGDTKMDTPYIGPYSDSAVIYKKYVFDNVYYLSGISMAEGKSLEQYMDGLPQNTMWKIVCRYLDLTPSKQMVEELRLYCKDMVFDKAPKQPKIPGERWFDNPLLASRLLL